jgi:hypothetical protein
VLVGFVYFIAAHVTLVAMTGFRRNMNHIVLGTDNTSPTGMVLGFIGIALVVLSWIAAHYISWYFPRGLQHVSKTITDPLKLITLGRLSPRQRYTKDQISPYFWPNGKLPVREDWKRLEAGGFRDYRLKIGGMVENPVELSLDQIRALGEEETITMHHCIQGWSGIAQWRGVSLRKLIEYVRPKPGAGTLVFYSFGPAPLGGLYYDTQSLYNDPGNYSVSLRPYCFSCWPSSHPLRLTLIQRSEARARFDRASACVDFHHVLRRGRAKVQLHSTHR